MILQACSKDNEEKDITVDINSEHIQMELTDKIEIDADITPYDKYREGISSYYLETYVDMSGVFDEDTLVENALFFKQDIYSVIKKIGSNVDGAFDIDNMQTLYDSANMDGQISVTHTDEEGVERVFSYIWYLGAEGNAYSPEAWFECIDCDDVIEGVSTEHFMGRYITEYFPYFSVTDLSFAKAEESGQKWKKILRI